MWSAFYEVMFSRQRARAACADLGVEAELLREEMRDHIRPGGYDVVLNRYTSFGYFTDPGENLRVLRDAHASLVPAAS